MSKFTRADGTEPPPADGLDAHQDQIVAWVVQGLSSAAIAERLPEDYSKDQVARWQHKPRNAVIIETARGALAGETARMALSIQKPVMAFLFSTMQDEDVDLPLRLRAAAQIQGGYSTERLMAALDVQAEANVTTAKADLLSRVDQMMERAEQIESDGTGGKLRLIEGQVVDGS